MIFSLPLGAFWNPIRDFSRAGEDALQKGRVDEAARDYQKALEEEPQDPLLLHNLAVVLSQTTNGQRASSLFEKALSLAPASFKETILYHAGNHAFRRGDYETAIRQYTEALRLSPKSLDTKWNLELARLKLRENSGNQQQQQQQGAQNRKANASRQNESGGMNPTKGADPYDNPHDPRQGQGSPTGEPQKGQGGNQPGVTSRPSPNPSRLSQEEAEQLLQSLEDRQNRPLKTLPPQSSMPRGTRGRDW